MGLVNTTPHAAIDVPLMDAAGRDVVVVVVKATFDVLADGRVVRSVAPVPVLLNELMYDVDDPRSSVRYPSDICVEKRGTDVVVVGEASSPTPVAVMDVAVRIGSATVPLRVHGPRSYQQGMTHVTVGASAPFERQPIVYECAYGGMSSDMSLVELRNPSGTGVAKSKSDLVGQRAPQIEHPKHPFTSAGDQHAPVGYGATRPFWSPRRELAGTFDGAWMETRMPLMPRDFDARHNNLAHPSLLFDRPVPPGETIGVLGMTLRGTLVFTLPPLPLVMRARFDESGLVEQRPAVDAVLIEPNPLAGSASARAEAAFPSGADARLALVARFAFPVNRGRDVERELRVDVDD